ncbi:MAG TPA: hypothetical protein VFM18_18895 [Methanosarcina sp.]|nr:hypothetical protein [Methanosarcina sp.]
MAEWNPAEYLKTLHTRQLMAIRQKCHKFNGYYDICENNSPCVVTISQVKAELATREHVPNKHEARKIRQAKAKKKL